MPTPILTLILCLLASAGASQPGKRKPDPEAGKDIYEARCWQCHGKSGLGQGPAAARLPGTTPLLRPLASQKGQREALLDTTIEGRGSMPAYGDTLSRPDARRVFIYLEELDQKPSAASKRRSEPEDEDPERDAAPPGEELR